MIDLTRQHNDVGFAYRLATFLRSLEGPSAVANLRRSHPDDFPSTVDLFHSPISSLRPEYVIARMPTGTLIMIAGCQRVDLGVHTMTGYSTDPRGRIAAMTSPYFWDTATAIRVDAINMAVNLAGNVRIIGHSLGGAIAAALLMQISTGGTPGSCQAIALNAPRLGEVSYTNLLELMSFTRYFSDNDPVQFVPCHSDEAPLAHTMLLTTQTTRYNAYTNPRNGIAVSRTGVLTNLFHPTGPLPNTTLSILDWLTSGVTDRTNDHQLTEICQRLRFASDALEPVATVRARAAAMETAVTLRPRAVNPIPPETPIPQAEARRTIMASRPAAVDQAEANAAAIAPARQLSLFRPRKVAGTWSVVFEGQVVEGCQGKRAARIRARRYNRLARQGDEFATLPVAVSDLIDAAFVTA